MNPDARTVFTRPDYFLAYGFGSGLAPRAPGTAGSLVGLLVFVPVLYAPLWVQLLLIVLGFALGVWICDRVANHMSIKDPGGIVWDEFVGMWIAMLLLPSMLLLPVAFALFRLFDILKPWPVSLADEDLEGGLGIMVDDVVAGLYALASLQLMTMLYRFLW